MKEKILHILNGEITPAKFGQTSLPGKTMKWRDKLLHGPLFYNIDSELFWEMRYQFLQTDQGIKLAEFRRKYILEYQKFKNFEGLHIVIWCDLNLPGQINLLALLSSILRSKKRVNVAIIHPSINQHQELKCFANVKGPEFETLYDQRIMLAKDDLIAGDKAWMFYCSGAFRQLKEVMADSQVSFGGVLETL